MDRQYIRDNEVIERYLAGVLTPDEEQAFEEVYLGDPEILDQIEAAQRLRDGIKGLAATGRLERLRSPAPWRRILASPRYAAAASMLLAVSLTFSTVVYRENRTLREDGVSATSMIPRLVALESVRGGNVISIPTPERDELIVLQLDAGLVAYDTYRGVLTRRDGEQSEEIWSRADLVQQPNETIWIGVRGRALPPGEYEVRLEGRMNDWPAERFEDIATTRLTVVPRD
jgi:hypothetical protein